MTPFIATIAVPQRKKGAITSTGKMENWGLASFNCMKTLDEGARTLNKLTQLYTFIKLI
jgi:hypothetical protein